MVSVVHASSVALAVAGSGDAGPGEDVEAEVAPTLGPLAVLLGQHGSDQAYQGVAIREDAHDVGAAADLAVEPLVGV
jgi:hypothetical protein